MSLESSLDWHLWSNGCFVFGVGGFFLLFWVYSHSNYSNYSRNAELFSCRLLLALSDSINSILRLQFFMAFDIFKQDLCSVCLQTIPCAT